MADEVSISNQALTWVGGNIITSLNDDSPEARVCKANYAAIRDAVNEERIWSHSEARFILASPLQPIWGAAWRYLLPSNISIIHRVYRTQEARIPFDDWSVEEGYLVAGLEGTFFCKGIRQVTDVSKFPHTYVQALAARLAATICVPLTKNLKREQQLYGIFDAFIAEAASASGRQGSSEVIAPGSFNQVRRK